MHSFDDDDDDNCVIIEENPSSSVVIFYNCLRVFFTPTALYSSHEKTTRTSTVIPAKHSCGSRLRLAGADVKAYGCTFCFTPKLSSQVA